MSAATAAPETTAVPATTAQPPTRARRIARAGVTTLLGAAVTGTAAFLLARLTGMDTHTPLAQLIAYTPYAAASALATTLITAAARRWRLTVAAVVVVAVYAAVLIPRTLADDPAPASAAPASGSAGLVVMTANVLYGTADADELIAMVRRERPDVLSVQELTDEAVDRLDAAGIAQLLPYRALRAMPGTQGTGLYARTPLTDDEQLPGTFFVQVRAKTVHHGIPLDLVAAHPQPPMPWNTQLWRHELTKLPRADRNDGAITVLAGDFNATLDHSLLRELLASGYTDAAAAAGAGLVPTWSSLDRGGLPVTIDHVLVEGGSARDVQVFDLSGSDHRVVVARLTLPTP